MLDTLGSYIIGGIVVIMMTAIIFNMQDSARDTMFNEISQISLAEMSQTMEREMTNIGYRVRDPQKVVSLTYRSITFLSDFDNNGEVDTISYAMQRTRSGPVVSRTISRPGQAPLNWTTRGSMVLFTGYDENGNVTFDATRVRAVEASMLTSNVLYDKLNAAAGTVSTTTGESVSTSVEETNLVVNHTQLLNTAVDCTAGAYWHKTIYPKNITVEQPQLAEFTEGGNPVVTDPGNGGGTVTPPTDGGGTVTPPVDPVIIPPKNKNDPCPCGSGLKYRDCHGK
ncbi:MAG: SEC-C domain-containing protein [Bacteroidetes bacterium]|nr:SEC-C domain-containing protein [Bacteroidota bacterium]